MTLATVLAPVLLPSGRSILVILHFSGCSHRFQTREAFRLGS